MGTPTSEMSRIQRVTFAFATVLRNPLRVYSTHAPDIYRRRKTEVPRALGVFEQTGVVKLTVDGCYVSWCIIGQKINKWIVGWNGADDGFPIKLFM